MLYWAWGRDHFIPGFALRSFFPAEKPQSGGRTIEKMDCFIYDLHSGKIDDLKWAINALTNEPLDSEKTLIVISSVLSLHFIKPL